MPDATLKEPVVGLTPGRRAQIETLTRVCMDDLLGAFGLGGYTAADIRWSCFFASRCGAWCTS